MDFLLEMTPGTGWLARENNRVVFLPEPETVDIAHDVIEPLLVPRETAAAFDTLRSWLETGRPLPALLLVGLDSLPPLIMAHRMDEIRTTDATKVDPVRIALAHVSEPVPLSGATSLGVDGNAGEEPSGMLIEGVVRAGGFRVHLHNNASARTSQEVALNPTPSVLQLHLDEYSVEVGDGIVIGRWPYKHADFDPELEPLILADPAVSRLHAEIKSADGAVVITDKNSHNGTWVRSAATGDRFQLQAGVPHPLHDGDHVLIGDTTIRFGGSTPT